MVFELTVPENGLIDAGIYSPAVDDGFYVMLRPLPAGQHTIHITGVEPEVETCNALNIDITYSLTMVTVDLGRSR